MDRKRGRPRTGTNPVTSIRIDPLAIQKARDAAITQKTTLGKWLKEAIEIKIDKDRKSSEE